VIRSTTCVLVAVLLAATAASARPFSWRTTGAPPAPFTRVVPVAVSDDGLVLAANLYGSDPAAYRWQDGVFLPLGTLPTTQPHPISAATHMASGGAIVFGTSSVESHLYGGVFRWENGVVSEIARDEDLRCVSADGRVLLFQARVVRDGVSTPLPYGFASGRSTCAAADGDPIAGASWVDPNPRPMLLHADGTLVPLEEPDAAYGTEAVAVSNDGAVVAGLARTDLTHERLVVWTDGVPAVIPMPVVPGADQPGAFAWDGAEVTGMSADGRRVIGNLRSNDAYGEQPFVWDEANGIRLLGDVVPFDFHGDVPWLDVANAISPNGDVIAAAGFTDGILLTLPDACANGIDDDGDGLVDLADPGCADASDYTERGPSLPCDDGVDEDLDGVADFPDDPSCPTPFFPAEGQCSDGIDDDRDGLVDLDDPGCESATDPSEHSPLLPCDDGIDNDSDWSTDYVAPEYGFGDPGCLNVFSATEAPACNDGIDNDGDGGIDDWSDPECAERPWGKSESKATGCGIGAELAGALGLIRLARSRRRPPTTS